jgi:hypothetical protein
MRCDAGEYEKVLSALITVFRPGQVPGTENARARSPFIERARTGSRFDGAVVSGNAHSSAALSNEQNSRYKSGRYHKQVRL